MSEQISKELLDVMNEISNNETIIFRINASIFVRNSQKMINEKVAYLYNMLKLEAKNCKQRQDNYYDDIELIITHYKQKLNLVYDEFYCQYVNIQNEIQEAKTNRRIAIINYQKLVNNKERVLQSLEYKEFVNKKQNLLYKLKLANTQNEYNEIYKKISQLKSPLKDDKELKEVIIKKNEIYKDIIQKCNEKFDETKEKFEKMINEEFVISSKSLQMMCEQNFFQRLLTRFSNIFSGGKKYVDILKQYNKDIDNIDSHELLEKMRNDIVEFVADILEMKGFEDDGLENARIGGKDGNKTSYKKLFGFF